MSINTFLSNKCNPLTHEITVDIITKSKFVISPLEETSIILDGIFIGASRTKDMRFGMAISFVIFCLSVWLLFDSYGNAGVWASMMILFVVRALTLSIKYFNIEKEI